MIVAAIGVADLLGRLLGADAPGGETLARTLAFTLVGLPLALLIAWWTGQSMARDPEEAHAVGYAIDLTVAALIALVVARFSLQTVLAGLLRGSFDGGALAAVLVWGALWALHWWLAARALDHGRAWPHLLFGSLIGLGTTIVALGLLLGSSLEVLLLDGGGQLVVGSARQLAGHGATLAVGILVAFVAGLAAVVLEIPALSLTVSAAFVLLMSGLILYETSNIIHGGETNYVMATVSLYVTIFNLFTSLLQLLGFANSSD